jgi:hypothetical protein
MTCQVMKIEEEPILLQLPVHLTSTVIDFIEGGRTVVKSGAKILKVPAHCKVGERIVFRTEDFTYVSKEI